MFLTNLKIKPFFQQLKNASKTLYFREQQNDKRNIWGYVAIAFNKVDLDRLKLVGPDRLCAEWVLKNGGGVRLVEMPAKLLRDYNTLPPENTKFHLKVIDGTKSSIMKIGLQHFQGCQYIDTVIFDECKHLEEDGLDGLMLLNKTLKHLQVSGCYNISDKGMQIIGELKNLEDLKIFNMKYVENMAAVVKDLQAKLPKCQIDTNK